MCATLTLVLALVQLVAGVIALQYGKQNSKTAGYKYNVWFANQYNNVYQQYHKGQPYTWFNFWYASRFACFTNGYVNHLNQTITGLLLNTYVLSRYTHGLKLGSVIAPSNSPLVGLTVCLVNPTAKQWLAYAKQYLAWVKAGCPMVMGG